MHRPAAVLVALTMVLTACTSSRSFDTVDALYDAAGGEPWCGTELTVTLAPFVGNCGDPSGDSRVVLGISFGGDEIRASVDAARDRLASDGQLLLVPDSPAQEMGFQLRSRDRSMLEAARERIGGVLLDSEAAIDDWLGDPPADDPAEG